MLDELSPAIIERLTSETDDQRTAARRETKERFVEVVMSTDDRYPDRTAFVPADMPELATVLAHDRDEQRATVIVHADGSEVLIEPPAARA